MNRARTPERARTTKPQGQHGPTRHTGAPAGCLPDTNRRPASRRPTPHPTPPPRDAVPLFVRRRRQTRADQPPHLGHQLAPSSMPPTDPARGAIIAHSQDNGGPADGGGWTDGDRATFDAATIHPYVMETRFADAVPFARTSTPPSTSVNSLPPSRPIRRRSSARLSDLQTVRRHKVSDARAGRIRCPAGSLESTRHAPASIGLSAFRHLTPHRDRGCRPAWCRNTRAA